jgi:hypothetical protein
VNHAWSGDSFLFWSARLQAGIYPAIFMTPKNANLKVGATMTFA